MFYIKIIIPCIIATVLLFLLFFKDLSYKNETKKLKTIKKRIPAIIGIINICIIFIYGIYHLFYVTIFLVINTLNATIQIFSPIAFILIFFPLSIASIIISIALKNRNIIDKKLFNYGLLINIIASIMLLLTSLYLFTKVSKWF